MVETDRALARISRLKGVAQAYKQTFSGDAVVLTSGIVSATDWLASQDFKLTDRIFWDSNRAEVSSKGEFGYTAGAWTLRRDKKYSNGDFVRVWEKRGRNWKLVFEADTATDLPLVSTGQVVTPKRAFAKQAQPLSEDVQTALTGLEGKIATGEDATAYYLDDAYFMRPNLPPATGFTTDVSTSDMKPADERFIVDAPADLACTFGYLQGTDTRAPFLRVWRRDLGKGWRVTLEFVGKSEEAPAKQHDSSNTED
jgi:hypothetical protein